jgi:hypothetical protein
MYLFPLLSESANHKNYSAWLAGLLKRPNEPRTYILFDLLIMKYELTIILNHPIYHSEFPDSLLQKKNKLYKIIPEQTCHVKYWIKILILYCIVLYCKNHSLQLYLTGRARSPPTRSRDDWRVVLDQTRSL